MKEAIKNHFQNNYQAFYEKYLQGIKKIGGEEFKALCPFHEDTDPSFNFSNDTGLYHCHGCGKEGDAIHFYAKVNGLDTKKDFGKILKGIASDFSIPWIETRAEIEKTYDYTDADGKLIHQTVRMNPKDFQQRRPGNNGKQWEWNLKDIQCVLYNLPEVIKASEVLIVEGEKDTDNLVALGFTATTCAMGAKAWRPEYNESLKGKDIVLIPDNDLEGKEHMAQVGASLNGIAKSLKLLQLPGLKNKQDVSDFIETFKGNGNTAAIKLSKMIANIDIYEPPKEKPKVKGACATGMTFNDLEKEFSADLQWLWRKHIPKSLPSMVSGREGTGKTTFCLQAAKEILENNPKGVVVWIATEGFVRDTLTKMKTMGIVSERFQIPRKSDGSFRFNLYMQKDCNEIGNYLNQLDEPVLIVFVDSLRGASNLDANEDKMRIPIMNLSGIVCDKHGAACLWLHHNNKTKRDSMLDNVAGSPAITAAVRQILHIKKKSTYVRLIEQSKTNVDESSPLEMLKTGNDIVIREPSLQSDERQTDAAESFLLSLFKETDAIAANELFKKAEESGILEHPLKNAKRRLGIESKKTGNTWMWQWKI